MTINQRSMAEALNALRENFSISQLKNHAEDLDLKDSSQKNWPYAPKACYMERLEHVIGELNYRIEYDDFSSAKLLDKAGTSNEKEENVFVVRCRLTLFDDDRNPVIVKVGYGSSLVYKSSLTANLQNAEAAAFKNCCKQLRIGGDIRKIWDDYSRKTQDSPKPYTVANGSKTSTSKKKTVSFSLTPAGTFSSTTGKHFFIPVKDASGKEYTMVIWEKERQALLEAPSHMSLANRWEDIYCAWQKSNRALTILGDVGVGPDGIPRISFRGEGGAM